MSEGLRENELETLKKNVERLLSEYLSLKQKYEYLAVEYQNMMEKLNEVEARSENKNNVEPVVANSSEMVLIKAKIEEYIREIDDCIAMISVQD